MDYNWITQCPLILFLSGVLEERIKQLNSEAMKKERRGGGNVTDVRENLVH